MTGWISHQPSHIFHFPSRLRSAPSFELLALPIQLIGRAVLDYWKDLNNQVVLEIMTDWHQLSVFLWRYSAMSLFDDAENAIFRNWRQLAHSFLRSLWLDTAKIQRQIDKIKWPHYHWRKHKSVEVLSTLLNGTWVEKSTWELSCSFCDIFNYS